MMNNTMMRRLLTVSSNDPENARRGKLLNILLLGISVLTGFALLVTLVALLAGQAGQELETTQLLVGLLVMLIGCGVILLINRYGSGTAAGWLFLLLLMGVFAFSDVPREIANGRSLFIFAIPVTMSSVLLRPYASFIFAGLTGVIILALGFSVDIVPNIPAVLGFYAIALVSWLSARSLETALEDLRAVNRELDQRVIQRTQDLAAALARVQAESNKNQAILESIADGVIVFDIESRVSIANQAVTFLLERLVEYLPGSDAATLLGQDVSEADRALFIRLLKNEQPRLPGIKMRWGHKVLSISFADVRDASGQISGTVVVFRDFTREAELDRMKSSFVSMASHELRTPLNAILGYSDMLKEKVYGPILPEQSKVIDRIIANTRRMLSLVNNLLDQAQIEAGKLTLNPSEFSVKELLDDLHSMMGVLAEQKGLELKNVIGANVPDRLVSDPQRLHQILVNLVGNAIKFTDQGSVSTRVFIPDATHWALEVTDTGPGIPPEARKYVFEPFRQVDDPTTRRQPGSGLGLSIVKQLAALLGGDVSLLSEIGRGSTFRITLPTTLEEQS